MVKRDEAEKLMNRALNNKAFSKAFDKNYKAISEMLGDSVCCKNLIKSNLPLFWLIKGAKEIVYLNDKKKIILEQSKKIGISKIKKVSKIIVLVRTKDKNLFKKYPDYLGYLRGDVHEDFPFTKENNICYNIIYSPKTSEFRDVLIAIC